MKEAVQLAHVRVRSSSGDTGVQLVNKQYPLLQCTRHYWLLYAVPCEDLFPFFFQGKPETLRDDSGHPPIF